jgi:hypothetical protein
MDLFFVLYLSTLNLQLGCTASGRITHKVVIIRERMPPASLFRLRLQKRHQPLTRRGVCCVPQSDISYCQYRIAEEERLASLAPSQEAGHSHAQLAMLYRSHLTALYRSLNPDEHRY